VEVEVCAEVEEVRWREFTNVLIKHIT